MPSLGSVLWANVPSLVSDIGMYETPLLRFVGLAKPTLCRVVHKKKSKEGEIPRYAPISGETCALHPSSTSGGIMSQDMKTNHGSILETVKTKARHGTNYCSHPRWSRGAVRQ